MEESHDLGVGPEFEPVQACKVLIVDCYELTRIGLRYALQGNQQYSLVAETDNALSALQLARQTQPNVVILDVIPVNEAINLTREIKAILPEVKVVVLVGEQDEHNIQAALAAGVDAYCLKTVTSGRLFQIMDAVCQDAVWLDPGIAKKSSAYATPPSQNNLRTTLNYGQFQLSLTQRECEVLTLLTEGKSNKEIAHLLGISTHTVKTHVRNLIQKMAVEDRTQAVVKALHCGLVKHEPQDNSMLEV